MTTLRLRLRTWFGWSGHPEELSRFGTLRLRLATFTALLFWIGVEVFAGAGVGRRDINSINFPQALQRALSADFAISLAVFAYLGLPAIGQLMLARRAASDVLTTTQGRCFEVLLAPSIYLFARIGSTLESANWYPLPIEWDAVVAPSDDTYEVEYLPTSGWVHRVRRFGASPRELVQPSLSEVTNEAHAAHAEEEDKQPSAQEQRELRRYARRIWGLWGESAASIAACAWTGILGGIYFAPGLLAFSIWCVAMYPMPLRQDAIVAGIVSLATFFAIGSGCIIWGVWCLRLWRRVRRAAQQGTLSVEGDVVSWTPRNQDQETIVKVRADDGETKILRVRRSFNHRVRHVGSRVRIDYMPVSEYVADVRYAEAPVRAN